MRLDNLTQEQRDERAMELVLADLERVGITPGNASPALLAKTVRLLTVRSTLAKAAGE